MRLFFESGLCMQDIWISMPHWTEYSCANCRFTIPPTICIHIGCRPRYLTMRLNELASNGGVATTSYHWRLVQEWVIASYGWGICVRKTEMGGATTYFVFVRVCVCVQVSLPEVAHHNECLEVLIIAPTRKKCQINKVPAWYVSTFTNRRF